MADCKASSSSESEKESFLCGEDGCVEEFWSVGEHEIHYEEMHRHNCCQCGQKFCNNRRLEIHLEENHDPFFESLSKTNQMFRCYSNDCERKFMTSKERDDHCAALHGLTGHFDLDKRKRPVKTGNTSSSPVITTANQKAKTKVPRSVCFGAGNEKSFDLSALRKPWHQRQKPATAENGPKPVSCRDLAAALDSEFVTTK